MPLVWNELFGSTFIIGFTPKQGADAKYIKELIQDELDTLVKEGISGSELDNLKKVEETRLLSSFEMPAQVELLIASHYFPERDAMKIFKDHEQGTKVTTEQIKKFVEDHLKPGLRFEFTCLPITDEERGRWDAVKQEEDVYDQHIMGKKIRETEVEAAFFVHSLPEPKVASFKAVTPDRMVTLSNGLEVVLKRRDSTPFINGSLVFKDAELGAAYLDVTQMEDIHAYALQNINGGSELMSGKELRQFFQSRGASCSFGYLGCNFHCTQQELCAVADQLISMMLHPLYGSKGLKRQIASVIQNLGTIKAVPSDMARYLLRFALFDKQYSWEMSVADVIKKLRQIKRADLIAHNKKYLNPENMFLVVVGNFDDETIVSDLEKTFGAWKSRDEAEQWSFDPETIPGAQNPQPLTIVASMPAEQVVLMLGRVTTYKKTDDMYALAVIEEYLDKVLFQIRERSGLFYSGGVSLGGGGRYFKGSAQIAFPLSVNNIVEAEKAIKNGLEKVAKEGVPQEFINKAKESLQMSLVKSFSTNGALCASFARAMSAHEPWDEPERVLARYHALTKEQIDAVAARYLDPRDWTVIKAGRITPLEGEVTAEHVDPDLLLIDELSKEKTLVQSVWSTIKAVSFWLKNKVWDPDIIK